jgi:branched-chain amino acid transport system substrate-binding protein
MKTRWKRLSSAAALFAAIANVMPAYAETGVSDTEIVIGESVPLSGPAAAVGIAHALGTRLAVAEANAKGGINGRRLRLIQEDDGYVPSRTVQTVRKLIDVDEIFAITNTSSSAGTLGSIDYIEQSGVVMMNTFVNNSSIWTPARNNIFSIGQGYPALAKFSVKFIDSQRPNARWAVIVQDDDFGSNLIAGAEEAFKELGKAPVKVIRYKRGQQDFSAEMLTIKNSGATAVFSGAISSENVSISKEARRLQLDAGFGMMWTIHLNVVQELMGEPGNGAVFAEYTTTLDEDLSKPILDLARKHLSESDLKNVNRTTLASYAGAKVLLSAMERCGKELTRACAIKELEKTENFETGAMAPISFGIGKRFSDQKLRIIKNDYTNRKFVPLTEF